MTTIESNPIDNESRALLPIRSVSQITGVNPITLRAWERRYDLIRPTRTPAGHRLYSQQDIRTIQRIQELAESGMGFAQIALLLDQEDQQPTAKPRPEPVPRQAPPRSLLDRVIRAGMELDPAELRVAEATALMWLTPAAYLRDVLIEALAQLEARTAWPDRDLALAWLSEYIKGRADWVADAPGQVASPVVVVDNRVAGHGFTASGLRLFAALHDDGHHARLLPTGIDDTQREQLVRRWRATAWIRLGPQEKPHPTASRAGARLFCCDLASLEPRDGDEAADFMHRWRHVIEHEIRSCRDQVAAAVGPAITSRPSTHH